MARPRESYLLWSVSVLLPQAGTDGGSCSFSGEASTLNELPGLLGWAGRNAMDVSRPVVIVPPLSSTQMPQALTSAVPWLRRTGRCSS